MTEGRDGQWQPVASAPRDGSRVLVVIRGAEQGPGAVDVARWARPRTTGEACWIATDSDPSCQVMYANTEVLFWMPLPAHAPSARMAVLAGAPPAPHLGEGDGSGI